MIIDFFKSLDKLLFFRDKKRCMTKTAMSLSWLLVFFSTFELFFIPSIHWTITLSHYVSDDIVQSLIYAMYGQAGIFTGIYKWGKSKNV